MTPIKHDNPKGTGYIKINRKREVVQLLSKQMKKLYISPDGQKVFLKSLALKNKLTVDYRFEKLPSKFKPWYKYAMDLLNVLRQKTPKIIYNIYNSICHEQLKLLIYANDSVKCYMMENKPFSNIEIEFLDIGLNPKTPSNPTRFQVKVIAQICSETMELIYKDKFIFSKTQSFIINPYQNYDDLDEQQQYYVEEAQKCIALCIEANNECDDQTQYPVIIDHRSVLDQ